MSSDNCSPPFDQVEEGSLLYNRAQDEHYVIVSVAEDGITLARRDREYYIPHGIFDKWYMMEEVAQDDAISATSPDWID
jgi:hypothetical protein